MTLLNLIEAQLNGKTVNYSNTEAIYLSVPFTPDSEVRFGQTCFHDGGIIDGKIIFMNNENFTDKIDEYNGDADPFEVCDDLLYESYSELSENMISLLQ